MISMYDNRTSIMINYLKYNAHLTPSKRKLKNYFSTWKYRAISDSLVLFKRYSFPLLFRVEIICDKDTMER